MFSMITNIYNKKTKGPTLMELFTATGKLKKFFLTTRDVQCVHRGWHGTHWYSALLQWSVALVSARSCRWVVWILCTKCTLHSNHRLICVILQHTKRLLPRSSHFLSTYTCIAYRQKCELWRKTTSWEKNFWVVPSNCTGFVNTCPTVFL